MRNPNGYPQSRARRKHSFSSAVVSAWGTKPRAADGGRRALEALRSARTEVRAPARNPKRPGSRSNASISVGSRRS
jgi:hypothetical protein